MEGKMKTIAQITYTSVLFVVSVARIGADDDVQKAPSLFDQIRVAIPKLKPGMSERQVGELVHLNKLRNGGTCTFGLAAFTVYRGFAKDSQSLIIGSDE